MTLRKKTLIFLLHIYLTHDDLFNRYTEFLLIFSPNSMTWSFSLVNFFFNSLPLELQEVAQLEEYTLPDLFSVVVYKTLMDANYRIRKIMVTFFHSRNSNANSLITDADCHPVYYYVWF